MGINAHERFENHMDISSPETIGDAEKKEDIDNNDDEFEKRMSDVEAVKGRHSECVIEDDKPTIEKEEKSNISPDKTIQVDSAHMVADEKNENTDDQDNKRKIGGFGKTKGDWSFNTPATLEERKSHLSNNEKEEFEKQLDAGGGISGQRGHLRGAGREYWLTSNSSKERASGRFVSDEIPGKTPKEKRENLQTPPYNKAEVTEKVVATKPQVAFISRVAPQEEFAKKAGYKAREGIVQTFIPTYDKEGPLKAGILEIKQENKDASESDMQTDDTEKKPREVTEEEQQELKDKQEHTV